jgi:hypothetical protein
VIEKIYLWLLVKGSVALVVFVFSVVIAAVIPGFLLQKLVIFCLGWVGGLTARYLQRGGNK